MKKVIIALAVLFASSYHALAYCPVSVTCSLDGQYESNEGCYWNGTHQTCKFGHTHYGANGPEHHYQMVDCN